MGISRQVHIFRLEYETEPNLDYYVCHIGAYNHEEAVMQLSRRIGNKWRMVSSGVVGRLDDLSFEVRDRMLDLAIGKRKPAPVKKEVVGFKDISKRGLKPSKGESRTYNEPTVDSPDGGIEIP